VSDLIYQKHVSRLKFFWRWYMATSFISSWKADISVFSTGTRYWLDSKEFKLRWERYILDPSSLVSRPTRPPVHIMLFLSRRWSVRVVASRGRAIPLPSCLFGIYQTASSFPKVSWTLSKVLNFLEHSASKIGHFSSGQKAKMVGNLK
jgi:hypothetical protein